MSDETEIGREITVASTVKGDHNKAAQKLLDAAHEYWRWRQKHGIHGAVVWIQDCDGRLIVFTRGEYAEAVQRAIRESDGYLAGPEWGGEITPIENPQPIGRCKKCGASIYTSSGYCGGCYHA